MEGRGLSDPPPPPPVLFSPPPPSVSLALPPPRTLRRREGELPGVLRGELLAVLETEKTERDLAQARKIHISNSKFHSVVPLMSFFEERLQAYPI